MTTKKAKVIVATAASVNSGKVTGGIEIKVGASWHELNFEDTPFADAVRQVNGFGINTAAEAAYGSKWRYAGDIGDDGDLYIKLGSREFIYGGKTGLRKMLALFSMNEVNASVSLSAVKQPKPASNAQHGKLKGIFTDLKALHDTFSELYENINEAVGDIEDDIESGSFSSDGIKAISTQIKALQKQLKDLNKGAAAAQKTIDKVNKAIDTGDIDLVAARKQSAKKAKSVTEPWAQAMESVIRATIGDKIDTGLGGMASLDGDVITDKEATKLRNGFKKAGFKVVKNTDDNIDADYHIYSKESDTKGIYTTKSADVEDDEVIIGWFDEKYQ